MVETQGRGGSSGVHTFKSGQKCAESRDICSRREHSTKGATRRSAAGRRRQELRGDQHQRLCTGWHLSFPESQGRPSDEDSGRRQWMEVEAGAGSAKPLPGELLSVHLSLGAEIQGRSRRVTPSTVALNQGSVLLPTS